MDKEERLKILRKVTKLDFRSFVTVYHECKKAERLRNQQYLSDSTHCYSTDYSIANELEYELRMDILRRKLSEPFIRYISVENDGATLEFFVEKYLEEHAYSEGDSNIKIK